MVKSLKELVLYSNGSLGDDINIVKQWLIQPEIIANVPKLLTDILTKQLEEKESYKRKVTSWVPAEIQMYYDSYKDKELASKLALLTSKYLLEADFTEEDKEWMKTNIPRINVNDHLPFYAPFYEGYLNKNGIYMKNDKNSNKMKVGMFGGKFLPLHLGHKYCIDVASQQCDKVYAIMFTNGDDELKVQEELKDPEYLAIENRFNKLKEFCSNYNNVEPVIIDTNDCKYEDGSEDWDAETPLVRAYIPEMYRVYSSEPHYGEYFSRAYPEAEHIIVDAERKNYPISATMLRGMTEKEREEWL